MRFTILAHGSRGDVQPYLALGLGLRSAGHQVRLAAPELFRSFIEEYGLEFAPLAGDPTQLMDAAVRRAGVGSSPLRIWKIVQEYVAPVAYQVHQQAYQACWDADAVIHSLLTTLTGHEIARQKGIPDFSALVFALFTPTRAFPNILFPQLALSRRFQEWYHWESHQQFNRVFWSGSRIAYRALRRKHSDLPPLSGWPWDGPIENQPPILYGFSPHVLPRPTDWGPRVHVTGYWLLDTHPAFLPPPGLVDFLAAGPPPIAISFGSVVSKQAAHLAKISLEALAATGQRGVLVSGWGGLNARDVPANVYTVPEVPFEWLLPQCAAAVHHGGIGTTALALQAGIPSFVTPFMADQPFWGRRVHALGVGPRPVPAKRLTASHLTRAINQMMIDESMRTAAQRLATRLRAENGVRQAVAVIQNHLCPCPVNRP